VGVSVTNALSEFLEVEVIRDRELYTQRYERGKPKGKLKKAGKAPNRRGTKISFKPDEQIFGKKAAFDPKRLYRMSRSKAYLFAGVKINWKCAGELLREKDTIPESETLHFPNGLADFLEASVGGHTRVTDGAFNGTVKKDDGPGRVEWALTWIGDGDSFVHSYCNTVPTPDGGTHEAGLRAALTKGLRAYGELKGNKKAANITADDVMSTCAALLSVFIREPEFQGQTKDRLANAEAQRLVENAVRDHFEHWLTGDPKTADKLLAWTIERVEERQRRRQEKEVARQAATRKLRLPGKLADCSQKDREGTEIFLVEGDSAGGSAKQARNRATQAILPLRGKILNVASASAGKIHQNQELSDLIQALGVGLRDAYREDDLRYEKVIIMTDADVDGAHIASLLMTFFYRELPGLIADGHLYLALPPLYRLHHGGKTLYARNDAHRDELLKSEFKKGAKVEISRFKGLGEMLPKQLKETTMLPGSRTLLKVEIPGGTESDTEDMVESLMGKKAELRYRFIQENAEFVEAEAL
jgi:topoisomerase-4 subunit B